MQLYEKYRPKRLSQVRGQDKAISKLTALARAGQVAGKAFWISGRSGTGKTTLARVIAGMVADDWCIVELDAGKLTPATVEGIEQTSRTFGWGKGGRAYIVNEAHGLAVHALRRLLTALEPIPEHVVWIFTTTRDGQESLFEDKDDAGPLLSRCVKISLTTQGLCGAFSRLVSRIATRERLNGRPLADYERLAKTESNNCRAMLQAVGNGDMVTA